MTNHELFELCQLNRDWRIERTSEGEIIAMPPTGGRTGRRNFELVRIFSAWAAADGSGVGFDSSTGFVLPNGAERSPDLAWVRRERWDRLTSEEQEEFPPLCPDFVIEIRSRADSLSALREKMLEYVANGAQLGWLLDPEQRCVYVYHPPDREERFEGATIRGDPHLPGFTLDLAGIWD
jgi:Uma2 family endonuclease